MSPTVISDRREYYTILHNTTRLIPSIYIVFYLRPTLSKLFDKLDLWFMAKIWWEYWTMYLCLMGSGWYIGWNSFWWNPVGVRLHYVDLPIGSLSTLNISTQSCPRSSILMCLLAKKSPDHQTHPLCENNSCTELCVLILMYIYFTYKFVYLSVLFWKITFCILTYV
jgi:hypothetical protein